MTLYWQRSSKTKQNKTTKKPPKTKNQKHNPLLNAGQIRFLLFCFIHGDFWNLCFPPVIEGQTTLLWDYRALLADWTNPKGMNMLATILFLLLSYPEHHGSPRNGPPQTKLESRPSEWNFWTVNLKTFCAISFQGDAALGVSFKTWLVCVSQSPVLSPSCWVQSCLLYFSSTKDPLLETIMRFFYFFVFYSLFLLPLWMVAQSLIDVLNRARYTASWCPAIRDCIFLLSGTGHAHLRDTYKGK